MPASERTRELKRRRKRKSKLAKLKQKVEKASPSEKAHIASKIRRMTPGAEVIIQNWELESTG